MDYLGYICERSEDGAVVKTAHAYTGGMPTAFSVDGTMRRATL